VPVTRSSGSTAFVGDSGTRAMPAMPGAAGVSEGPADTRKHIPVETACYVFKAAVWPQSRAIVRIVCELLMVWCTHSHWVRETSLSISKPAGGPRLVPRDSIWSEHLSSSSAHGQSPGGAKMVQPSRTGRYMTW